MTGAATKAVRAVIAGRVQGVWFRAWTVQEAERRGLAGWVRNRRDGRVEALFAGPAERVDEMLKLCRDGPPNARVADVAIEPAAAPDHDDFRQLPTA